MAVFELIDGHAFDGRDRRTVHDVAERFPRGRIAFLASALMDMRRFACAFGFVEYGNFDPDAARGTLNDCGAVLPGTVECAHVDVLDFAGHGIVHAMQRVGGGECRAGYGESDRACQNRTIEFHVKGS